MQRAIHRELALTLLQPSLEHASITSHITHLQVQSRSLSEDKNKA
jgi:hypothetical protein